MSDMEIYVDNLAAMQIHNMNKYIEFTRAKLQEKGTSTTDHYMKTLEAATIKEDDYFANLLGSDIAGIAKDIKEAHKKDSNTGNDTTEVDEIEEAFEQIQKTDTQNREIEEVFQELDTIAEKLESGDTSLEDSFRLYKKGMELLKYCSDRLDTVEKKMLQMDEDGTLREF